MSEYKAFLIRLPQPTLTVLERKADEMGIPTSALIRTLCIELATGTQLIHRDALPPAQPVAPHDPQHAIANETATAVASAEGA